MEAGRLQRGYVARFDAADQAVFTDPITLAAIAINLAHVVIRRLHDDFIFTFNYWDIVLNSFVDADAGAERWREQLANDGVVDWD